MTLKYAFLQCKSHDLIATPRIGHDVFLIKAYLSECAGLAPNPRQATRIVQKRITQIILGHSYMPR